MASKIRAKLIMELRDQGMLRRLIAKTRHMSMANVCEVFVLADEKGITWGRVMDLGDNEACAIFYPERQVHERVFEEPDWHPKADVRSIDLTEKRGLARLKVTELSTCGFVERGTNVVVPTLWYRTRLARARPTSPAHSRRRGAPSGCAPAM